jgi:dihydrodipicolinate synthase/N-acetylneuraminate lyase
MEAEAMGAAMVMMMPPYHGAGLQAAPQGIFEHFSAVNDAISIPIMVQDAPLSGVNLTVDLLARMARELENVSYFKIECPFAADKLAALIEAAGDHIEGPFDGEEAVTLLADLDAGATGTMTSAMFPEKIRPIVTEYRSGNLDAALDAVEALPAADQSRKPPMRSPRRQDHLHGGRRDRQRCRPASPEADVATHARPLARACARSRCARLELGQVGRIARS